MTIHSDPARHPSLDPLFNPQRQHRVWYLSHPLAGDESFSFEQNMEDVVRIMRICFEEGIAVVAPYHTICLALDDEDPKWRRIGLEIDCNICRKLGLVLLTGHKISSGMLHESNAVGEYGKVVNLTCLSDEQLRVALQSLQ